MTRHVSERKLSMQYEMALLFIGVTVIHDEKKGARLWNSNWRSLLYKSSPYFNIIEYVIYYVHSY